MNPQFNWRMVFWACVTGALLWAALIDGIAHANPVWTLDVNTISVHAQAWERDHLNQQNYGLGLTYRMDGTWGIAGGWYDNSFRRTSAYLLAEWTPWQLGPNCGWHVRAGLSAGLDSGYRHAEVQTEPLIAAGLVRVIAPQGWDVNLEIAPSAGITEVGFVGVQLALPL